MSKGLIIAAPSSGSGKTTVTLALLRKLSRDGTRLASAKAGPDYIDSAYHTAASGAPCLNLDTWAMRPELIATLVRRLEASADLVICEGVMGLFDGIGADGMAGSTAELALRTGWPVVLVVDGARQGASVVALIEGFARHRAEVPIAGVIFNRTGSARHDALLREATKRALPGLPILGSVPREEVLAIPHRHLGLVQAAEHEDLSRALDNAAETIGRACDLAALLALARPARPDEREEATAPLPVLGQRIAVARDIAFAFAYPALLEGWREAGAELSFFSPLADEPPDPAADAVYLPGGYPELHAGRLAANRIFRTGLQSLAAQGAAIYGECGGYMMLGEGLVDALGERHEMAGLLPLVTSFADARLHLGYRAVELAAETPLGKAGRCFRGHEFHYAEIVTEGDAAPLFQVTDATGESLGSMGALRGRVTGSFIHLVDQASNLPARIG
jgi:cobyrinic acid a,c-diamide synthase